MPCDYGNSGLPTIEFVGGETQDLMFRVFFYKNKHPFSLTGCTCNFSIVNFTNRTGAPILSKSMKSSINDEGTSDNVLMVTLEPAETVDLCGKYIYQVIIKDMNGDTEIPKQGVLYITNNINKSFV